MKDMKNTSSLRGKVLPRKFIIKETGRMAVSQSPGLCYQQRCICNNFFSRFLIDKLAFGVLRIVASEPITGKGREIIQVNIAVRLFLRTGYVAR